jgi:hypothetical protein
MVIRAHLPLPSRAMHVTEIGGSIAPPLLQSSVALPDALLTLTLRSR